MNRTSPAAAGGTGQQPTLFVMVGLPGVGKTTLARQIEAAVPALRLTPDDWMIPLFGEPEADGRRDVLEGRLIAVARHVLGLGCSVVLDFGVWARDERAALRDLAESLAARFELVYLDLAVNEQQHRVQVRSANDPDTAFDISAEDMARYRQMFQRPDEEELAADGTGDTPPVGYRSWAEWRAERWPTSA